MEQEDRLFTAQIGHVAAGFDLTNLVVTVEGQTFIDLEAQLFA